jgi:hypothetical protein
MADTPHAETTLHTGNNDDISARKILSASTAVDQLPTLAWLYYSFALEINFSKRRVQLQRFSLVTSCTERTQQAAFPVRLALLTTPTIVDLSDKTARETPSTLCAIVAINWRFTDHAWLPSSC